MVHYIVLHLERHSEDAEDALLAAEPKNQSHGHLDVATPHRWNNRLQRGVDDGIGAPPDVFVPPPPLDG